jgi:hypothetical protein
MKHIKLLEEFVNENMINESETFDGLRSKFEKNPYGIGAQLSYYEERKSGSPDSLVFKHDEKYRRDMIIPKLKSMGVPSKNIIKSVEKGYKYPFVVTVTKF